MRMTLLTAYHENVISGFALDVYSSEPVKENFINTSQTQ